MEITGTNKKHLPPFDNKYLSAVEVAKRRIVVFWDELVDTQNVCWRSFYLSGNYQGLFCYQGYHGASDAGKLG